MRVDRPYHLRRTLECGQVFRWTVGAEGAHGIVGRHRWQVRQQGRRLFALDARARSGSRARATLLWRHLAVGAPLARIEERLARDPLLRKVIGATSGIAVMRQDLWECLVSFVISSFNNIPKIRLSVDHLCRRWGEPLASRGFAFPAPVKLAEASLRDLRACSLGYRAEYVRGVARAVLDGSFSLKRLPALSYADAREALMALPGVGEKVAECILLFALGHGEAFPVDVWVQRAVREGYFRGRSATPRQMAEWARARFGPLAGYANQHLFLAARSGLI